MSAPIEDYAMIGDGETAALVRRTGSIDWLCWPRFDSDACFAALLGNEQHGRWLLAPKDATPKITRRYRPDTLVLETDFEVADGEVRVIDFMSMRDGHSTLVRIVVGLRGSVVMHNDLALRFNYGTLPPWAIVEGRSVLAEIGPDQIAFRAPVDIDGGDDRIRASFTIDAGQRLAFSLSYGASNMDPPPPVDAEAALDATDKYWRDWIGRFDKATEFPDAVRRSLITLKALIYRSSGGLVAAPTTSLPEIPGGSLNWDYRYCWLRDATFSLTALLNAGYSDEAEAWRDWILRAIAGQPDQMQIMYRVDGARHIEEWEASWLPGYGWATPVLIGNAAVSQTQADIYGEVIDAFHLASRAGVERTQRSLNVETAIVAHIEKTWMLPGSGLWESRGKKRHYVYARAMAWVGVDRFIKGAETHRHVGDARIAELKTLRQTIHDEVCREGFHTGLGRFVEYFGGQTIDACLLLLPLVGFLPADDPRIAATIDAIERELMEGGLVRRKKAESANAEGTFLACSFWLADCRAMQGRRDEARAIVKRVLSVSNDLGLLTEQYDVPGQRLVGNFPQALTHLALVNTVLGLSGDVLQRGGG